MPEELPRDVKRTETDGTVTEFVSADDQQKLDERPGRKAGMSRGPDLIQFFGITSQDRPPSGPR